MLFIYLRLLGNQRPWFGFRSVALATMILIGSPGIGVESCRAAQAIGGSTYISAVSQPHISLDIDSTENIVGAFRNVESHSEIQTSLYSTRADAAASISWGHSLGNLTPGSGIMITTASSSASVSSGLSQFTANSSSMARINQQYDAPVTVLVCYSMASPSPNGHIFGSSADISTFGFREIYSEGRGSLLLEGITEFNFNLSSSTSNQVIFNINPTASLSARASILWSVSDGTTPPQLPGGNPDQSVNPTILSVTVLVDENDQLPSPWTPLDRVGETTNFYSIPVVEAVGFTEPAYFSMSTQVNSGPNSGAFVTGYLFVSDDNVFTSFSVPELPPGAGSLEVTYGSQTVPVVAGQEIDFGEGVTSFALRGVDINAASPADDAFVYGLSFANQGLASAFAVPLIYIPPGDHNQNGLVDAADYTVWRDGLASGDYTQDDYNLWRQNFGSPSIPPSTPTAQTPTTVPEPSAAVLVILMTAVVSRWRINSLPSSHRPQA